MFKIYNFQFFSSVLKSPLSIKNIGYNNFKNVFEYFLIARLIWNLFICSHDLLWMLLYNISKSSNTNLNYHFEIWNSKQWLQLLWYTLSWMHLGEKEAYNIGDVLHVHPFVKSFTYQCQWHVLDLSLVINSLCFFTWSHAQISLVTISSVDIF